MIAQLSNAQYYMNIYQNNGNKLHLLVTDLDSINFSQQSETLDEYDYVDLGLSVNWATRNIGAGLYDEDYGDYYAWGEIEPKKNYTWTTYEYSNSYGFLTKYCSDNSYGYNKYYDNKTTLDPSDDVAHVKLGGVWRLPSYIEFCELQRNCSWEWTVQNGVKGYLVTSKIPGYTSRSIFLPAAGDNSGGFGVNGYYWSSSLKTDDPSKGWHLFIEKDNYRVVGINSRYIGQSVRPVFPSETWIGGDVAIKMDVDSVSMTRGYSHRIDGVIISGNYELCAISDIVNDIEWLSSNNTVATVNDDGMVQAVSLGTSIITAKYHGYTAECVINVRYDYVDLGLSVMWATCNVGAEKPEEYGDYYAWGETEIKSYYDWDNYKYCNGNENSFTKYCKYSYMGYNKYCDSFTTLTNEDDVAHVKWGNDWRIPTKTEYEELINNCTWTPTIINGVKGNIITSNVPGFTNKYIFMPASGCRNSNGLNSQNNKGWYWMANLAVNVPYTAWYITLKDSIGDNLNPRLEWFAADRTLGCPIRPVMKSNTWKGNISFSVSRKDLTIAVGTSCKLNGIMKRGDYDYSNIDDITWSSGDSLIASVDGGIVIGKNIGKTTIYAVYDGLTAMCEVSVVAYVQPEAVDLGLSVKWASFNVGASNPEGYGNYYAWGETETKVEYSWKNYKWANGDKYSFTKYCRDAERGYNGYLDNLEKLDYNDDVARVQWGGSWRMPTDAELSELAYSKFLTWTWTTQYGVNGYVVTSNKAGYEGNSIFLPATGFFSTEGLEFEGELAYYLGNELYPYSTEYARNILITSRIPFASYHELHSFDFHVRYYGCPIRPVCP